MDSPNDSKPLREIKQMLNLEKESSKDNSENNSSHTFIPTSNVRMVLEERREIVHSLTI